MLVPTVVNVVRPFYSVGNTVAVSLTRNLPHGQDAHVLSLGCGDVRNILYTCYVEHGLPERKLDFTCCDLETNVIARNVLFYTLLLDKQADHATLWRIYYHLHLDDADSEVLQAQVEKLRPLCESLETWRRSEYGTALRFCDGQTLSIVRTIWSEYAAALTSRTTKDYADKFTEAMRRSTEYYKDQQQGFIFSPIIMKAAAPVSVTNVVELQQALVKSWECRLTPGGGPGPVYPNALVAVAMSEARVLAWPADALSGFFLATAKLPLTELSPLRVESPKPGIEGLHDAAKTQFKAYVDAFRAHAALVVLRFAAADCFALCHTLQNNLDTGGKLLTANLYNLELGTKALVLDQYEYGTEGTAPRHFDTIDTSNVSDYNGAVNMLVATRPLLRPMPWSTILMDLMSRGYVSDPAKLEALLCGHTRTVSLLLGLSPVEYWTNAAAAAFVDECFAALVSDQEESSTEAPKMATRLSWKLAQHFSGSHAPVTIKPDGLAKAAYTIYLDMFSYENLATLNLEKVLKMDISRFHRASFVALLKAVCKNVQVDRVELGRKLMDLLTSDTKLMLGSNYRQDLSAQLSRAGIYSESWLTRMIRQEPSKGGFYKWNEIPDSVALTLKIPSSKVRRIWKHARLRSSFNVEAHVRSGVADDIYSDVQLAFGNVITRGARDNDDFSVSVEECDTPDAPLIVTFYVSTAGLQAHSGPPKVSLCIQCTPLNLATFRSLSLDAPLIIFEAPLSDEKKVFVSKFAPGLAGFHVIGGQFPSASSKLESRMNGLVLTPGIETYVCLDVESKSGNICTLTGHLDINTHAGKRLLSNKAPIEVRQQASPFALDVVLGKNELVLPLVFPVPILSEQCRLRVARTSGYIEVIATPVADPVSAPTLADFILPTSPYFDTPSGPTGPTPLNVAHVNLDSMPIISVADKKALGFMTHLASFIFSTRERQNRERNMATPGFDLATASPRLNFKESLFSMLMLATGVQGGHTGLFSLGHPNKGGIHALLLVSAVRLDGAAAGVILDAAILFLTKEKLAELNPFLQALRLLECCAMTVDDAELVLWKRAVPAMAERCRTWRHNARTCEYRIRRTVPASSAPAQDPLCSCGRGRGFPAGFIAVPEWEKIARRHATRVAISPVYAAPFVEAVVPPDIAAMVPAGARERGGAVEALEAAARNLGRPRCRNCGAIEAEGGAALKKCGRCLKVSYCSALCQRTDWKKHRMECEV